MMYGWNYYFIVIKYPSMDIICPINIKNSWMPVFLGLISMDKDIHLFVRRLFMCRGNKIIQ